MTGLVLLPVPIEIIPPEIRSAMLSVVPPLAAATPAPQPVVPPQPRQIPVVLKPADAAKQMQSASSTMAATNRLGVELEAASGLSQKIPDGFLKTEAGQKLGEWGSYLTGKAPEFLTNAQTFDKKIGDIILTLGAAERQVGVTQTDAYRDLVERSKPGLAKTQRMTLEKNAVLSRILTSG